MTVGAIVTASADRLCTLVQCFPILLILAQKYEKCLDTPLIYKPPEPTNPHVTYDEALHILLNAIGNKPHDHYGPYDEHNYGHGHHGSGYYGHGTPTYIYGKPHGYGTSHDNGLPYYASGVKVYAKSGKGHDGGVKVYSASGYPQTEIKVYSNTNKDYHGYSYPHTYTSGIKVYPVNPKGQQCLNCGQGVKVLTVNDKTQIGYGETYAPGVKVYPVNMNKYRVVVKNKVVKTRRRQNEKLIQGEDATNLNTTSLKGTEDSCITAEGGIGTCINIRTCGPFIQILQAAQTDPNAINILRRSHCGFDGNDPKVCCPTTQPIPTSPPPSPDVEQPPEVPPVKMPDDAGSNGQNSGSGDNQSIYVDELPDPPECGFSNASFSRVVGGVNAKLGDFPWMALLGYKSVRNPGQARWLCGGTLVTAKHVLTAAHCIHGREDDLYLVRLGELDISKDDEGATPVDVPIVQKSKHESYSAKSFTNDIGILLLSWPVQFTALIRPICLPKTPELRSLTFERYTPIIAGWGDTEFRGPAATHLQALQLPVVSNNFCANAYKAYKAQVIDERVLCAGYEKGGRDACQGDSGGPLMQPIWNSETYKTFFYQIGVVSYGRKCAEAGFPGVYSRTTHFMPWLYQHLVGSPMP